MYGSGETFSRKMAQETVTQHTGLEPGNEKFSEAFRLMFMPADCGNRYVENPSFEPKVKWQYQLVGTAINPFIFRPRCNKELPWINLLPELIEEAKRRLLTGGADFDGIDFCIRTNILQVRADGRVTFFKLKPNVVPVEKSTDEAALMAAE